MNLSLSLKTLGQAYIALDDFFKAAEEKWTLKSINCALTPSYKFKYVLLVEKTDELAYCIEEEELEDFTHAIISEFQATLDAEVEGYSLNICCCCTTGMVELIIA